MSSILPSIHKYIDPISQDIFTDPVIAEDGYTYSKETIMKWFVVCESNNRPYTSPLTGCEISTELISNDELKKEMYALTSELDRYRRCTDITRTQLNKDCNRIVSLRKLVKIFEIIPPYIRESCSEWNVPQFAVIGEIGSGKSSLLERLVMYSLFPCGPMKETCMPLIVKLRYAPESSSPILRVIDTSRKVQIGDAVVIPTLESAHSIIADTMRDVLVRETVAKCRRRESLTTIHSQDGDSNTNADDVSSVAVVVRPYEVCIDRAIVVHFYSPSVPTIDLVDLPGLLPTTVPDSPNTTSVFSDRDWKELRSDRLKILDNHVLMFPNCMYIAVTESDEDKVRHSCALDAVRGLHLQDRTIGVITKCDKFLLRSKNDLFAVRWGLDSRDASHGCDDDLQHGYLFTSVVPPSEGSTVNSKHDEENWRYTNMLRTAVEETMCFMSNEFEDAVRSGRATCEALVSLMGHMYLSSLRESWVPRLLRLLVDEYEKLLKMYADIGLPAPPCDSNKQKDIIATSMYTLSSKDFVQVTSRACRDIVSNNFSCLCQIYGTEVLHTFQQNISRLVLRDDIYIKDCLLPGNSVDGYIDSVRNSLIEECRSSLTRACTVWRSNLLQLWRQDSSACRLGRFDTSGTSLDGSSTGLLSFLADAVHEQVKTKLSDALEDMLHCVNSFTSLSRPGGCVTVEFDFTNCSNAVIKFNMHQLSSALITILTREQFLISIEDLSSCIDHGLDRYMNDNDGNIPEVCSELRTCIVEDLCVVENAARELMAYLCADFNDEGILLEGKEIPQRSVSKSTSMLYSGAWGGSPSQENVDSVSEVDSSSASHVEIVDKRSTGVSNSERPEWFLCELRQSGVTIDALKQEGFTAKELRLGGFSAAQLIGAGFTIDCLRDAGFSLGDDKYAGFTLAELRMSGGIALSVLAAQRRLDGASACDMATDGFTYSEIVDAGFDLLAMLRGSDDALRIDAARCIHELVCDESNEDEIIAAGVLDPLVHMVRSEVSECCLAAAAAIGALACNSESQVQVADAGAIPALVDLLRGGGDSCKDASTWALRSLARDNAANMTAIALAGAVDPLVDQLLNGTDCFKESAARALCNLACDSNIVSVIASAGAIKPLVQLLSHGNVRFEEAAARALCNLACDCENMVSIAAAGAIEPLVSLLSSTSEGCQEAAAWALRNLACDEENVEKVCELGAVDRLVAILGPESSTQLNEATASALGGLACNKENKVAIGNAGAITRLLSIIRDNENTERWCEAAVWVLGSLISEDENRRILKEENGIDVMVHVVRKGQGRVREACAWAFRYLTHGCADVEIVTAGGAAIPMLIQMLSCGSDSSKEAATWALCSLACDAANCMIVVDSGALGPLLRLLRTGSEACKEAAAWTLQNIGPTELRQAGFTLPLLRSAGVALSVLAAQRRLDGVGATKMAADGFTFHELQEGGFDLVSMLLHGSRDAQLDSLEALRILASEEENALSMGHESLLFSIGVLLQGEDCTLCARSANLLQSLIYRVPQTAFPAFEIGVHVHLVRMLWCSVGDCGQAAADAIGALASDPEGKARMIDVGAIPALVNLLRVGDRNRPSALRPLYLLCVGCTTALKRSVVEDEGVLEVVVDILRNHCCALNIREDAADLVRILAYDDFSRSAIVKSDATAPLVDMLSAGQSTAERAVSALRCLTWYHSLSIMHIVDCGGIEVLIELLKRGSEKCKAEAAWVLNSLVSYCGSNIALRDAIDPLIKLVESNSDCCCEAALCTLGHMVKTERDIALLVVTAGGLCSIVGVLKRDLPVCRMAAACCLNNMMRCSYDVKLQLEEVGVTKELLQAQMCSTTI